MDPVCMHMPSELGTPASITQCNQAICRSRHEPELVLTQILHHLPTPDMAPFGPLLVVAKEPIHVLRSTPDAIWEKLRPFLFPMHYTHIASTRAEQLPDVDQLVIGVS